MPSEMRGTASLTWTLGQFQIGALARYTGSVDETALSMLPVIPGWSKTR
jgi:hypothetical protein